MHKLSSVVHITVSLSYCSPVKRQLGLLPVSHDDHVWEHGNGQAGIGSNGEVAENLDPVHRQQAERDTGLAVVFEISKPTPWCHTTSNEATPPTSSQNKF